LGYLIWQGVAYRCRRVRAAELQQVGHAHLEGSETYAAIREELGREAEEAIYVSRRPAEEREQARAELEAKRRKGELRALRRLEADPVSRQALIDRASAYVRASVDAAARLADPASVSDVVVLEAPAIVGEWEPWQWVADESEEDHDAGRVCVSYLPDQTTYLWGQILQALAQGVTRSRVAPFRAGSADAPPPAPPGDDVPHGSG
jgi:hypothetical protein